MSPDSHEHPGSRTFITERWLDLYPTVSLVRALGLRMSNTRKQVFEGPGLRHVVYKALFATTLHYIPRHMDRE